MNTGGEAGEQMVRMSLNGVEVAAKITGAGAKQLAVLLYTILKEQDKTKGAARLSSMLRSGKELKVFTVKRSDLKTFAKEAKRYGVLYCALKGIRKNPDGLVDVMVRAEDASKINRIVERFELAAVDKASIRNEITEGRAEKAAQTGKEKAVHRHGEEQDASGITEEESQRAESFLDELMGTEKAEVSREPGEEKSGLKTAGREKPGQEETEKGKPQKKKPGQGKSKQKAPIVETKRAQGDRMPGERQGQTNARLSEPISTKRRSSGRTSSDDGKGGRRSVRAELEQIRQSREKNEKKAVAEPEKKRQQKQQAGQKPVMHQQPKPGKRRRKEKER